VRTVFLVAAVILAIATPIAVFAVRNDQRTVLWHVVQLCVADQVENGRPRPCALVDLKDGTRGGYVVLDDPFSRSQYLVMPTRQLSGIESPEIAENDAPNYWEDAWRSRSFVTRRLRTSLPRDGVGLAVNSSFDRSQDQLHIHVDCLQPDVRQLLDAHVGEIGTTWKQLAFDLEGRRYWSRRVEGADLLGVNPFRLLAEWVNRTGGVMWKETLVVAGVKLSDHHDGFVLLADAADPAHGARGHGESLLDHSCSLVKS